MPKIEAGGPAAAAVLRVGPPKYVHVARAFMFLGLCYLAFTLWASLAAPGAATTVLPLFDPV